jgi:hypothetical protein
MEKSLQKVIVGAIVFGVLAMFVYFFLFVPNKESNDRKLELDKARLNTLEEINSTRIKKENQESLTQCVKNIDQVLIEWLGSPEVAGATADTIKIGKEILESKKQDCYKLYN